MGTLSEGVGVGSVEGPGSGVGATEDEGSGTGGTGSEDEGSGTGGTGSEDEGSTGVTGTDELEMDAGSGPRDMVTTTTVPAGTTEPGAGLCAMAMPAAAGSYIWVKLAPRPAPARTAATSPWLSPVTPGTLTWPVTEEEEDEEDESEGVPPLGLEDDTGRGTASCVGTGSSGFGRVSSTMRLWVRKYSNMAFMAASFR